MKYVVRKSLVYIVGTLWQPGITAASTLTLSAYDIENIREYGDGVISREGLEQWLTTHSGDYSSVLDFAASIEDGDATINIAWENEENEMTHHDCIYGSEC